MKKHMNRRRGYVAPLVGAMFITICGFVAFGVDMGLLYSAKGELQRTADAAALSAAAELLSEQRLRGKDFQNAVFSDARTEASAMAALNPVRGDAPIVNATEDVTLGLLNSSNTVNAYAANEADDVHAVEVTVRRDDQRGGPIDLFFGSFLGIGSKDIHVEATAAFEKDIVGFSVIDPNATSALIPFALHVDYWNDLVNGVYSVGDNYTFDGATHSIVSGADGVPEINLYPGAGIWQLPPGNFGTVDVGPPNNSTTDLERQILYGPNAADLAYFPDNTIRLNADGKLYLQGDTGMSAGIKDELETVKNSGDCRVILLFSEVAPNLNGNNSVYTIVGFAGIHICHVKLTGPMSKKKVIIQPSYCSDPTAIGGGVPGSSQYVFTPPRLVN